MDIDLLNQAEIARRLKISPAYCTYLLQGKRTSERRLEQIASLMRIDTDELKRQIEINRIKRIKRHGHAGNRAPAHNRTRGVHPRTRSACL